MDLNPEVRSLLEEMSAKMGEWRCELGRLLKGPQSQERPGEGSALRGKPGRPITTFDLATFAQERRERNETWKTIYSAWNEEYPDRRVESSERVREAWRRFFGDKSKSERKSGLIN
jgi:hypothetical protein